MSKSLAITLLFISLLLFILITVILKKGRIPEKYALLWYAVSSIILFLSIVPNFFSFISKNLGFNVMSNFIIGVFIGLLLLLVMALTIIVSGQKKKITLLIQEISLMKEEMKSLNKKKNKGSRSK